MRIVLLIDSIGPGGAQRQMVGLAGMLRERGCQVKLIYYHPSSFYKTYLDEHHVPYECVASTRSKLKRLILIGYAFRRYSPDVVITFLDKPNMMACILKAMGMRFRLIVGERNTTQSLSKSEKLKFFFMRKADAIVPNSYSQERFIKSHFPHQARKVHTIINFVDLCTYRPVPNKKRSRVIVVAASVWQPKNTLGLIEAAKIIKEHSHTFTIWWYGIYAKTPYVEKCQEKIAEYGLGSFFQLLPKTASIAQVLQDADYFCLPSFYEGTPNALCEALACGLPVVCSRVCDNGIYVEEGANGFLFDPRNHPEMANKIEKILSLSDKDYQSYSSACRKMAETYFSETRFIEEYLSLLEK